MVMLCQCNMWGAPSWPLSWKPWKICGWDIVWEVSGNILEEVVHLLGSSSCR